MFDKYCDEIKKLESFEKEDILNEKFELFKDNNMAIYYAPHNEIINDKAKVFIVGITPGWTQTKIAYMTAHDGLIKGQEHEKIKERCKQNSRFAGSMRKNLVEMLDELKLNQKLKIKSCTELFKDDSFIIHTTSIIPYPVFIKNKNYTGNNPRILDNDVLTYYMKEYFYNEVKKQKDSLIIPLGKSVEEVLNLMIDEGLLKKEQCLLGFPHPSGANGHRKKHFELNKENLLKIIDNYFIER